MGVYIKGMEMPTDCAMLLKIFPDGRVGVPVHLNWCGTMVVNDAEAIAVPPHGRLGDLDALIEKVIAKYLEHERKGELVFAAAEIKQDIVDLISNAPTVIPAEEGE